MIIFTINEYPSMSLKVLLVGLFGLFLLDDDGINKKRLPL